MIENLIKNTFKDWKRKVKSWGGEKHQIELFGDNLKKWKCEENCEEVLKTLPDRKVCVSTVSVMMGLKFLILGKRMVFSLETWPKTHQFSCSMMWKSDSADVVWPPQKRQTINFNFNFCTIYILTGNSIVPVVCDFLSLCYVFCSIVSFRLYISISSATATSSLQTNERRIKTATSESMMESRARES